MQDLSSQNLVREALLSVQRTAGLTGSLHHDANDDAGIVELSRGSQRVSFSVLPKPTLRAAHLASLRERGSRRSHPPLVVTQHVSVPLAEKLRAQGLAFIDAAGNAFVEAGGWYVWVTGQSRPPKVARSRPLSPSVWQVAYALLRQPQTQAQTVRQLAAQAGVSAGAAQNAIAAL